MRALAAGLLLLAASAGSAQTLEISGSPAHFGCEEVHGDYVAFLSPNTGSVLLANRPFPGGARVGSVDSGKLQVQVPGYGEVTGTVEGVDSGTPIWGMLDRSLEIGDRRGCFGFGPRRFSDVDDLKTYLHWFIRHILDRVELRPGAPPLSVWLAGRRVTIEILTPSHRALRIRGHEGTTLGFQARDSARKFFFQPFVLGSGIEGAMVRVSSKDGDYYGPGLVSEIAFVRIAEDEYTSISGDPSVALKLVAIEESGD